MNKKTTKQQREKMNRGGKKDRNQLLPSIKKKRIRKTEKSRGDGDASFGPCNHWWESQKLKDSSLDPRGWVKTGMGGVGLVSPIENTTGRGKKKESLKTLAWV